MFFPAAPFGLAPRLPARSVVVLIALAFTAGCAGVQNPGVNEDDAGPGTGADQSHPDVVVDRLLRRDSGRPDPGVGRRVTLLRLILWPLCAWSGHPLCVADECLRVWECRCGVRRETAAQQFARIAGS